MTMSKSEQYEFSKKKLDEDLYPRYNKELQDHNKICLECRGNIAKFEIIGDDLKLQEWEEKHTAEIQNHNKIIDEIRQKIHNHSDIVDQYEMGDYDG